MKEYRRVEVQWIDSMAGDCYWQQLDDFKPSISKPTSYGFLIHEDDEKICLAQTLADNDDIPAQVNGIITIPKVAILSICDISIKGYFG